MLKDLEVSIHLISGFRDLKAMGKITLKISKFVPGMVAQPRQEDQVRSGVQDQSGQYGETVSLLKIQKLAWHGGR